jgi:hypothetical protein
MRCILTDPSVHHVKGERGDNGHYAKFEDDLEDSIKRINAAGYNGNTFRIKIRTKSKTVQRLGPEATSDERAKELSKKKTLGHMFHKVGPQSISVDEIFVSNAYRERKQEYKKQMLEYGKLKKLKDQQEKGKALLQQSMNHPNKKFSSAELTALLKWKLGNEYKTRTQGIKVDELRKVWDTEKDQDMEDIDLPPPPLSPKVPGVDQTALGRSVKRKFTEAIAATANSDVVNEEDFNEIAGQFKQICDRRGLNLEQIQL